MSESFDVPVGEWVDVPKDFVAAPDTYVDAHGVLRSSVNHAIAVWHNRKRGFEPCSYRVTKPDQIAYDPATGAPWCPKCFADKEKKRKLELMFGPPKDQLPVVDPTAKDFKDF